MSSPAKLAWQYVLFHKYKSLILIACIVLTALLPIAVKVLMSQFDEITKRADVTPSVVGSKGSSLDLTLNAIYFKRGAVDTIPYGEVLTIRESSPSTVVPIHALFSAREHAVVGTSLDYFDFRGLQLGAGSNFTTLGDCVLGCEVAEKFGLQVGDYITSDRDNVLNLAGPTPLRLNVVGILDDSQGPDDLAIFVDVKTAWVIQGLGHGHQDLSDEGDESAKILSKKDGKIIASPAVVSFIEITPENLESFHFHGDTSDFPITSIIVVSQTEEDDTILEGQIQGRPTLQFTKPTNDMQELMSLVLQVKQLFDANAILIAISMALLLLLVVLLSLRLRKREMETMFKLGCSRSTIVRLQSVEMLIIFGIAAVLLALATAGLLFLSGGFIESILVG